MKIVLEAFGKLRSEPIDVPENTGPRWKMALKQPLTAITSSNGGKAGEIPALNTICVFEWTGKLYGYGDGEFARIYQLADIYKA